MQCVYEKCGFAYSHSILSGKHKMPILYILSQKQVVRYNELRRIMKNIGFRSLTLALRDLEENDLIIRKEYPQIPPKVEYFLSEKGKSLIPILNSLCEWGQKYK